jgi:steroid delta-isomerase-like uncharacterized protein
MGHAASMRQFYERINAGDLDGFMDMISEDFVERETTEGVPPTKEGVKQFFQALLSAFPDLRMEAEDVIESGDKAVARVRCAGTQTGEWMGMPPSGKSVDIQAIDIIRFDAEGKAVEHWGVTDMLAMMQQLGVNPEDAPA